MSHACRQPGAAIMVLVIVAGILSSLTPAALAMPTAGASGAIISNGVIQLGVNPEGHLNVTTSGDIIGLRYLPTNADAISVGCTCEGWGVADLSSNTSGYVNDFADNGAHHLNVVQFSATASEALSVVNAAGKMLVTHAYHPSPKTPNLYQADVTIENISGSPIELRYRRVMDWDVPPSVFNEYVTINGTLIAPAVAFASNNGFASANPLAGPSDLGATGDFRDAGPYDHGALFDFNLGTIALSGALFIKKHLIFSEP